MLTRMLIGSALLLANMQAIAQSAQARATENTANWEVLQKLYPARALAAREEGEVGFEVTLDSKGGVTACEVTHSSGHSLLDQETCDLVALHASFKPEVGVAVSQVRTSAGTIAWKLPANTIALNSATQPKSTSSPEKLICRKSPRTGSLASFDRTCMTEREWRGQSDQAKEMWEDIQGKKGSTSGN